MSHYTRYEYDAALLGRQGTDYRRGSALIAHGCRLFFAPHSVVRAGA
jgi:hypothetical protein